MNKNVKYFILLSFLLLSPVRCNDEDDDEDVLLDFAIGVAIGLCQSSESCNSLLTVVMITLFICSLISCLCGDERDREDFANGMPSCNKLASSGAGWYLGKDLAEGW
jgi:hypothetical protein